MIQSPSSSKSLSIFILAPYNIGRSVFPPFASVTDLKGGLVGILSLFLSKNYLEITVMVLPMSNIPFTSFPSNFKGM